MTEDEARRWISTLFGTAAEHRLAVFADLLRAESAHQNLVSAQTLTALWSRHLVDSAQLVPLARDWSGTWVDVGSGAGLPGLVVAILSEKPVLLVEPRRLRVAFLERAVAALGLEDTVRVLPARSQSVSLDEPAAVISARAVAALGTLFESGSHLGNADTIWLLPKGRSVASEVAAARQTWQGVFHVEPSITDPDAGIVIARGVRRR